MIHEYLNKAVWKNIGRQVKFEFPINREKI